MIGWKQWVLAWAAIGLIGSVAMAPTTASAQAQTPVVRQALLQFEANMLWEAVSQSWRGQRGGWIAALNAAQTPQAVAAQLAALENAMGWGAVQDSWHQQRPGWVGQVQAAATDGQVAQAILVLEQATRWSAMNQAWRGVRPGWVGQLGSVR